MLDLKVHSQGAKNLTPGEGSLPSLQSATLLVLIWFEKGSNFTVLAGPELTMQSRLTLISQRFFMLFLESWDYKCVSLYPAKIVLNNCDPRSYLSMYVSKATNKIKIKQYQIYMQAS